MVKLKTLRIISVMALVLCAFKLGEIQGESNYLKRIIECVNIPSNIDMKTFYGHSVTTELWNHARAHNSEIYIRCIFKDIYR